MIIDGRATKYCKRINAAGHAHELTFSCYKNQNFLLSERACNWLADSITAAKTTLEFDVWAYVFMPNHVHLLILPKREVYSISEILKAIKTPVAVKAIEYLRSQNPKGLEKLATGQQYRKYRFWQKGGGYDRNLTKMSTLVKAVKYIHNNPVRKGLCGCSEEWLCSSACQWQGSSEGILKIDKERWPAF